MKRDTASVLIFIGVIVIIFILCMGFVLLNY